MRSFVLVLECVYHFSGDCQFYVSIVGTLFQYHVVCLAFCFDI